MTFLKSKKRFGQFETLETKKLFAADLAAFAWCGLPYTVLDGVRCYR